MLKCVENPNLIYNLKKNCINEYEKYTDAYVLKFIEKELK